jgi:hypothetical protein
MKPKKTKQQQTDVIKRKARKLYREGFTTREIGNLVKRSHAWVALVVKEN